MLLHRRRLILGVLIASQLLTGCTSWQVVPVSPRELVDSAHVSAIQVREKGGARFVLDAPRVSGDSLTGTVTRRPLAGDVTHPIRGVPLAAIDQVAIRKPDAVRTILGVLTVPAVGLFFFAYSMRTQ